MIKYLGSKRTLVPVLGTIAAASGANTAVDLFSGTTRVAQEYKKRGLHVTAVDIATYTETLARCYIETDAATVAQTQIDDALKHLESLPGTPGYFTQTFCQKARYFQPKNGERIDAMRQAIADDYAGSWLEPILLTALMEAADRVDSTTGVQMAYLKNWAPRAHKDIKLRPPALLDGNGKSIRGDAMKVIHELPDTQLMYLDPPYNQHRYYTNYHIWETLIRWDAPESYGVACKRVDARDEQTKSVFNKKREMKVSFFELLTAARSDTLVVSYNDEAWIEAEEITTHLREIGYESVELYSYEYKRYVGAQIGIYNPLGEKVGKISHTRNREWIFVAAPASVQTRVRAALDATETPLEPTRKDTDS